MKKLMFISLMLGAGLALCAADRMKIKFGTAVREITPPVGSHAQGWSRTPATIGVREKFYLRVLAIRDFKGKTLVLVSGDMLMTIVENVLKKYCTKKHKIQSGDVLMNASHTHNTPYTRGKYGTEVIRKAESAIDEALANLQDGYVKFGLDHADIGISRRYPNKKGKISFAPYPKGYFDPDLPVFAFYNNSNQLKTIIWSYAAHPTLKIGPDSIKYLTSNVPGIVNRSLHQLLGPKVCTIFLQGAAGDVWFKLDMQTPYNAKNDRYGLQPSPVPLKTMDEYCMKVAKKIAGFIKSPDMRKIDVDLAAADGKVTLHYDLNHPNVKKNVLAKEEIQKRINDPKTPAKKIKFYEYLLKAGWYKGGHPTNDFAIARIRINDKLQILGIAGEPTSQLGRAIKDAYPGKTTVMLGYISQKTYITTALQQREGGYEAKGYLGKIEDIFIKHFNSLKLK